MSGEKKKCCTSKGFCNTARKSIYTSVLTKVLKVIPYVIWYQLQGWKRVYWSVHRQSCSYLPSVYKLPCLLTVLSFPVPLEKSVVYHILP